MNYIVFDLEWNQPDESMTNRVTEPFPFDSEIIEFGAIKLDDNFKPVDEKCLFVSPHFYPVMSSAVARLTKIGRGELKNAKSFPAAWDEFTAWCGMEGEYAFMTWGPTDVPVLLDNMILNGVDTDNFPSCYDLQRIFGREILRENRQCSLERAVEMLNLRNDHAHDALSDARCTAQICDWLDLSDYLEEYRITYIRYAADRLAASGDNALQDVRFIPPDSALMHFECPWCGGTVDCNPHLRPWNGRLLGYARCPDEDEFQIIYHTYRQKDGGYRVRREIREMSDDLWEIWQNADPNPENPEPE